jgi:pyruvate/2-oxoglutarate dehydrogenase complex dihydrolipoamide dehydrogenase (E3) component
MPTQPSSPSLRQHDVIVIGGGSAGYAAARVARDAGADVAVVDHGPLGGLCILRGCMPTKAILRSAEVAALVRRGPEFGLSAFSPRVDLSAVMDRKNRLVQEFAADRIAALHDPKMTLYESQTEFISPFEIRVGTERLTADAFVIATGSVVSRVAIPGLEEAGYLTSDSALELRRPPASLVVLGGGPVAVEFAQFFSRIGTAVTIVQRSKTLLSDMDEDVGHALEVALRGEGIDIIVGACVESVSQVPAGKAVHVRLSTGSKRSVVGENILQALGRRPNLQGLGLDRAGISVMDGRLTVTSDMRTMQPHIFAVGDANDLTPVVHLAVLQGEVAGYNAAHLDRPSKTMDHRLDMEGVYTEPQVAVAGLSERVCRARAIPHLTATYPFADHGKAMCLGATQGFVKLICDPRQGELLGAQLVGPDAVELIHELLAVMYFRGTAHDLLRIPHYHPTLAEILTYPAESIVERLGSECL